MAEKKPLVNYNGTLEEIRTGDTVPDEVISMSRNIDGGAPDSVYLPIQIVDGGEEI